MLKKLRGTMTRRFMSSLNYKTEISAKEPEKSLISLLPKKSGRDSVGHISSRHHGGRQKRFYRLIDFRRDKFDVPGHVVSVEYDPNRNANIALVHYSDGEKRYILHPEGLLVGSTVVSGKTVEVKSGNATSLTNIPIGTPVHNIELAAGQGGILVRGAGTSAIVLAKEGNFVTIKLPSGETRLIAKDNLATIGSLDNAEHKNVVLGKAGRSRHMGRRPEVRGTAQNPRTHPHGGGEGRSGEGMKQPKTPWGKPARGLRTRKKNKHSNKYIVERRSK